MAKAEVVVFQGITFRRYPESRHRTHRCYFSPSAGKRYAGFQHLHREVWKAEHGPIPDGHHIHHRDENPLNNDLSNLECVSKGTHLRTHSRVFTPAKARAQKLATKAARAWHSTPAGREWHKQHVFESIHKPKSK